jgi:hypothetical protein
MTPVERRKDDAHQAVAQLRRQVRVVATVIGAAMLVLLIAVVVVFTKVDSSADAAVSSSEAAAEAAQVALDVTEQIQQSRAEAIEQECRDVNLRNERTVNTLRGLIRKEVKEHPEREAEIREGVSSTILLIDALVPVRDCHARVEDLTDLPPIAGD